MKKREKLVEKLKKADITIAQIVTFIILVLGFIILLVFYYNIDFKGNLATEICKESVLFRATAGQISGLAQAYVPLKCKTEKFCITTKLFGSGNCEKEYGNGATGITTVKVSTIEQLEKFYSEEVFRCWSMMGEGKVSLFYSSDQTFGFGETYPSCVICSRIAFDNINFDLNLSQMNVNRYMTTHKVPGREYTYSQYLSSNTNIKDIASNVQGTSYANLIKFADELADNSDTSVWEKLLKKLGFSDSLNSAEIKSIDLMTLNPTPEELKKENAVMFMQIVSPKHGDTLKNGVGAIGLTLGAGFVLAPKMTVSLVRAATSWWTLAVLAIAGVYQQGSVAYNRAVTAGYCSDVMTGQDAREGCSVVRTVDYDVQGISSYCQNIESIP